MDRGLKERLAGAAVLVGLAVLFVPSLLDGPTDESASEPNDISTERGVRTIRIEPPGSNTADADADGDIAFAEQQDPEPTDLVESDVLEHVRQPVPDTADPMIAWAVQVGSFASEENARRLVERLMQRDYPAFVVRHAGEHGVMFRVRVGPEKDKDRAEVLAARLKNDGQTVAVVRHP
ncbi:MAG: SPOR domain-containing protein [Gammaproteobacteria bacterium]